MSTRHKKRHTLLWEEVQPMPKSIPAMGTCNIFTQALSLTKMVMIIGRFAPGERLVPHHHKEPTEEIYYVASRKGLSTLEMRWFQ